MENLHQISHTTSVALVVSLVTLLVLHWLCTTGIHCKVQLQTANLKCDTLAQTAQLPIAQQFFLAQKYHFTRLHKKMHEYMPCARFRTAMLYP